jgi:hypothetical protein
VATKARARTKAPILEEPPAAPIAAREEPQAKMRRVMDGMRKKDASPALREEFREMLDSAPDLALIYGNLSITARNFMVSYFENIPIMEESIKARLKQIRKELTGSDPLPVEALLADAVVLAYQDYFTFATIYGQQTSKSFQVSEMEQWERILASKEGRYLRAIETLARVRRLLKLPSMQLNVALPHSQQVNVAGELPGG